MLFRSKSIIIGIKSQSLIFLRFWTSGGISIIITIFPSRIRRVAFKAEFILSVVGIRSTHNCLGVCGNRPSNAVGYSDSPDASKCLALSLDYGLHVMAVQTFGMAIIGSAAVIAQLGRGLGSANSMFTTYISSGMTISLGKLGLDIRSSSWAGQGEIGRASCRERV